MKGNEMNRFDYVKYDDKAVTDQTKLKEEFQKMESLVDSTIESPRAKALVHTKLEEAYMWVGKGIRDDQFKRNGTAPLQETRSAS
jgi:hypothetical protein